MRYERLKQNNFPLGLVLLFRLLKGGSSSIRDSITFRSAT